MIGIWELGIIALVLLSLMMVVATVAGVVLLVITRKKRSLTSEPHPVGHNTP